MVVLVEYRGSFIATHFGETHGAFHHNTQQQATQGETLVLKALLKDIAKFGHQKWLK